MSPDPPGPSFMTTIPQSEGTLSIAAKIAASSNPLNRKIRDIPASDNIFLSAKVTPSSHKTNGKAGLAKLAWLYLGGQISFDCMCLSRSNITDFAMLAAHEACSQL